MSNTLVGTNVSIAGGTGADTLVAGLGAQTLTGGSGAANIFVIAANGTHGAANITISDFGSAAGNMVGLFGYGANEIAHHPGDADHHRRQHPRSRWPTNPPLPS